MLDQFQELRGDGAASVSMSCGMKYPYGDASVIATVKIVCAQDEKTINVAGERAFMTALDLCKSGMEIAIEERNNLVSKVTNG